MVDQLIISINSLRTHNTDIAIVVFCHGVIPEGLSACCAHYNVSIHQTEDYAELLRGYGTNGYTALARYPLLHKFMNFAPMLAWGVDQVLSCDCDTIFFQDPEILFERYGVTATLVAREEVGSSRNLHGPNTDLLDEMLLAQLAEHEGCAFIPPFNLGLVLINDLQHVDWSSCQWHIVDYAWRLVSWMACNPLLADAPYAEYEGLAEAQKVLTPLDQQRALPYPSANRWILDEVALWLALGRLNNITTADFLPSDVVQNGELDPHVPDTGNATVWHYFSTNSAAVDTWLSNQQHFHKAPGTPEEMFYGRS